MLKKLLKRLGLIKGKPLKNPSGRPPKKLDLVHISVWHRRGISNREIARRLGVSEGTIRSRLKQIAAERKERDNA